MSKCILSGCVSVLFMLLAMGCAEMAYYGQAAAGQWQLMSQRTSIAALRDDPTTPEALRQRLVLAGQIRDFAVDELGLPDNASYRSYVDVGRPYVVRNVFAAPALALEPEQWCFPVAGCVSYRGYFDAAAAEDFAAGLRKAGLDVFVGNVPAYSTLGWFSDPLLNTFIHWQSGALAELLFHELAHQRLYVAGDTVFNESFATFVGRLGARRFLAVHGSPEARRDYQRLTRAREAFEDLVLPTKQSLQALYDSPLPVVQQRQEKQRLLADLLARYEALKAGPWEGFDGFDDWFYRDLNNAKLASLQAYTRWVPAFAAIYQAQGEDLARFYRAVESMASLPVPAREARLRLALQPRPALRKTSRGSLRPAR